MDKTLVFEDRALAQGFTQIPNAILRCPDLSAGSRLLYAILLSYAWQDGECFPGQERLAADLDSSVRTVQRYLDELKEVGLIRVIRRGRTQTNIYVITSWSRLGSDTTPVSYHSESDTTPVSCRDTTPVSYNEYSDYKYSERRTQETESDPIWSAALSDLKLQLLRQTFDNLLTGTRVVDRQNGTLTIGVRNDHNRAWLDSRLRDKIEGVLADVAGQPLNVRFQTLEV